MTLAETWTDLEQRAPEQADGRMTRRIHPDAHVDLHLGVEVRRAGVPGRRLLELTVVEGLLRDLELPHATRLVEVSVEPRGPGRAALVLALEDPTAREVFALMCADVATATARQQDGPSAVTAYTGRFETWRRMMQSGSQPMSARRQRGLFAELMTIRDRLVPTIGFDESVRAWLGPDGAPRDFEVGGLGVETKSSAANEPQVVLIHGERQLDDAGLDALLLLHHSLEVHRDSGTTLPGIVAELRVIGEGRHEAGTFEDRLVQSGYLDLHTQHYMRVGYDLRGVSLFTVKDGFPRIVESDLVDGVGSVRYSLAIDACRDFETDVAVLSHLLSDQR